MPIGDYCQRDVRTIAVDATLRSAAQRMADEGVGCLVAVAGRSVRGILTDRDIALRVVREGLDPDQANVATALTHDPLTVHASSPLRVVSGLMRRRSVRRLPVVDDREELVGVIALDDLLPVIARELVGISEVVGAQSPHAQAARGAGPDAGPEVE
jgi:CBS domain-containing protein